MELDFSPMSKLLKKLVVENGSFLPKTSNLQPTILLAETGLDTLRMLCCTTNNQLHLRIREIKDSGGLAGFTRSLLNTAVNCLCIFLKIQKDTNLHVTIC